MNIHSDDSGWGEYLYDQGELDGFRWGSDSSGWESQHYYKFKGIWTATDSENL